MKKTTLTYDLMIFGCILMASSGLAAKSKPNVVLLLTDDQGYGDIAAHGNPIIQTPNMDRLHESSVRFTNFHVDPTCAPTRGALMTGKYAHHVRVWHTIAGGNSLRETEMTMADVFKASGYSTALFGKWHLGANYPYRPMDRGFEEWLGSGAGGPGTTDDYFTNDRVNDFYWHNGERKFIEGYNPVVFYDAAINYVKQQAQREKPFFIYVPTYAPHGPFSIPDPERTEKYVEAGYSKKVAYHYAMIEHIDDSIGRLLDTLEQTGVADDTLVIFMTDNGATVGKSVFNAGMRGGKGSEYDGGHRVPLFIRWPNGKLAHGNDITDLNAHIDVLPTLIELCGLTPPRQVELDGRSFKEQLYHPEKTLPTRVVCVERQRTMLPEKWSGTTAMQGSWRLVRNRELYNVSTDPAQTNNVINQHPEIAQHLSSAFDAYWEMVTPGDREHTRPIIGSAQDPETYLTSEEWYSERIPPWNHGSIAQGKEGNGLWWIHVNTPGTYQIEARRWPREAHTPITQTPKFTKKVDAWTEAGPIQELLYQRKATALPVAAVQLLLDGKVVETQAVTAEAEQVRFKLPLKAGDASLQVLLLDANKQIITGAYYVYVNKMQDKN